jgi:hypothetical protein
MAIQNLEFEQLLESVDKLTSEQRRRLRRKLDESWPERFGQVLDSIESRLPKDISEEEIQADIEAAIREVRESKP